MSRRPGTPGQRNPARPGMSFALEGLRFGNIGALLENVEWVFRDMYMEVHYSSRGEPLAESYSTK